MDSSDHIIYVTKNVWLSGAFLNGYFSGVWTYGLFKGYPYITRMVDSHITDGIMDGGRFGSSLGTYSDATNFGFTTSYHTGLVQNFIFKDNNIAPIKTLLYNSWMDIIYDEGSMTNIGQNFANYDLLSRTEYVNINLNGYTTKDVLSSESWFRDGYSRNIMKYSLGTKQKKYTDFIGTGGDFDYYFSAEDETNFINNNWTYSHIDQTAYLIYTYSFAYFQDLENPLGVLVFTSSYDLNSSPSPYSGPTFNKSTLNNTNIGAIQKGRYSTIEFSILDFKIDGVTYAGATCIFGPSAYPGIYFDNRPATYSAITQSINHIADWQYSGNNIRYEHFYNRKNLNMNIILNGELPTFAAVNQMAKFDYIRFYEVDMIPFFLYATESKINKDISVPYKGYAPTIDYNNNSFNFIGNISLTTDAIEHYLAPPVYLPMYTNAIYTTIGFSNLS